MYVQYDPSNALHKRLPLSEMVTFEDPDNPDIVGTRYAAVPEDRRSEADAVPWYYVVQVLK